MKKICLFITAALVVSISVSATTFAHPGRLDKNGGHNDYANGTYHYHYGNDRKIEYSSPPGQLLDEAEIPETEIPPMPELGEPEPIIQNTLVSVAVDGEIIEFDQPPENINGRVMVPIRYVVEKIGYSVEWDGETQSVYINTPGAIFEKSREPAETAQNINVYVDNEKVDFEGQYPVNKNGRILIPVRFVAQSIGYTVDWDGGSQTVYINKYIPDVAFEVTYSSAKVYKTKTGASWVQTIVEITNTGAKPLYFNSGAYDLEDANGKLIASASNVSVYPKVIDPGEKAYYYNETIIDINDGTELTIIPRVNAKESKIANIKLPVTDFELLTARQGGLRMIGRVENDTSGIQDTVYVVAILFDEYDNPIGQIYKVIWEEIASGNKIGFDENSLFLPGDITLESVAYYEVFAYPFQIQF